MNSKKILLICPYFFNYENMIKNELCRQGFEVILWNDKASSSVLYKMCLRLFPVLISFFSTSHYSKKLVLIKDFYFDSIIVIKGESLNSKFLKKLLNTVKHKNNYYYLWDSIKNVHCAIEKSKLFKIIGSFDPEDASSHGWIYRPLFSSTTNTPSFSNEKKWDLCFAGTVHSDRLQVIARIKNYLPATLNFYCFAYVPSKILLWVKKIVFPTYRSFQPNELTTTAKPYQSILDVFNSSTAIIDIEHPAQRGLTMRSIEVLLSNKKLITTNPSILNSDLYHSSRALLIDRKKPIIELDFLKIPLIEISAEVRKIYTIEYFVKDFCNQN